MSLQIFLTLRYTNKFLLGNNIYIIINLQKKKILNQFLNYDLPLPPLFLPRLTHGVRKSSKTRNPRFTIPQFGLLTFHIEIDRTLRRSQSIGCLTGVDTRILCVYREHVQRGEPKITSGSVPVTGGQWFPVMEPLHLHSWVGVGLNAALIMCALALDKGGGPIQLNCERWPLLNHDLFFLSPLIFTCVLQRLDLR